jgi:hypothetical protein
LPESTLFAKGCYRFSVSAPVFLPVILFLEKPSKPLFSLQNRTVLLGFSSLFCIEIFPVFEKKRWGPFRLKHANVRTFFIVGHLASPATRAAKHSVEFAADQLFDKLTRPSAHRGFNRIKPAGTRAAACGRSPRA